MSLILRGMAPRSVFGLLGNDENSASFALGWVLENSAALRRSLIDAIFNTEDGLPSELVISLQQHSEDRGFTDIEISAPNHFHAIIEAKRWWNLPSTEQLSRYLPRLTTGSAPMKRLVSVSAANRDYAGRHLPAALDGVPLVHLSWGDLLGLSGKARQQAASYQEKLWLQQLQHHIQDFTSMDRTTDNNVYIVALSKQAMIEGQSHTWIDVVEIDKSYFHPVGGGWPVEPPNYIGFRYHGKLQSVHHIENFDVVEDVSTVNPLWCRTDHDHFVYRLGSAMRPAREIRTGNIFRNGRVRCAIDTLLSGAFDTISEARDETKRRLNIDAGSLTPKL